MPRCLIPASNFRRGAKSQDWVSKGGVAYLRAKAFGMDSKSLLGAAVAALDLSGYEWKPGGCQPMKGSRQGEASCVSRNLLLSLVGFRVAADERG